MKYLKKYKLIKEASAEDTYRMECKIDINYHGVLFEGQEIDDIETNGIIVSYIIEIEGREYGLKGITSHSFKGQEELPLFIKYYPGTEDWIETEKTVKLNWDNVEVEYNNGQGVYMVEDLAIDLVNDGNGDIIVQKITVNVNTF